MAAALLRHGAARRLGGSMVRRAQAAVAEERGWRVGLGPRFVHTDERFRKEMFLEIQQKKEDLYDAISKAHEHLIFNRWNTRLLRELSIQVAPRPYDRNWCWLRIVKRMNTLVEVAGLVSLSTIIGVGSVFLEWPGAQKEEVVKPALASKGSADNLV